MSKAANSISIFHYADSESKKPFSIKISYTQEIYHGNELKERVDLIKQTDFSDHFNPKIDPKGAVSSLPQLEMSFDNVKTVEEKLNSSRSSNYESDGKVYDVKPLEDKFNSSKYLNESGLKKRSLPNEHNEKTRNTAFFFTSLIIVVLIAIFSYRYMFISYYFFTQPIAVDKVEEELYAQVFNQNSVIPTIISNLEELNQLPPKKILTCIVGPTGVGKSHLANILARQLNSNNIDIFHRSVLSDLCNKNSSLSSELRMKLYFAKYFVIVLDDLKYDDFEAFKVFREMTFAIEDTSILILTVFNTEMENCLDYAPEKIKCPSLIRRELEHSINNFHFINFQNFDELSVKLWLKSELDAFLVDSMFHDEIINSILEYHDIRCKGLKGLYSKLRTVLTELHYF